MYESCNASQAKQVDQAQDNNASRSLVRAHLKLARQARAGDTKAAGLLVEHYYRDIMYFAIKKVGRQDAEDVAQQAVIQIIRSITSLKDPAKYKSWMFGVVRNSCMDFLRKRAGAPSVSIQDEKIEEKLLEAQESFEDVLPEEAYLNEETRQNVINMIDDLPDNYATCLRLYYHDELSYKEIAEVLEVSVTKVQNDMQRGIALLRKRYADYNTNMPRFGVGALASAPILSQILEIDCQTSVSADMLVRLADGVQSALVAGAGGVAVAGSAAMHTTNTAQTTSAIGTSHGTQVLIAKSTSFAKIAGITAASIAAVGLVAGIAVFAINSQQASLQINTPTNTLSKEESSIPPTTPDLSINTTADMIGTNEAALLDAYCAHGVSAQEWDGFIQEIDARVHDISESQGYIYTLFTIEKLDKQLLLLSKLDTASATLEVRQQFGVTAELPRMFEVIMMFE